MPCTFTDITQTPAHKMSQTPPLTLPPQHYAITATANATFARCRTPEAMMQHIIFQDLKERRIIN
jgi:hypothetical protein